MLIAPEMSTEVDSKQKPPGVVARLMGLDTLPLQQSYTASQGNHTRGSSRSQSFASFGSWQEEQEIHQYQEQNGYKDVHEIKQSHNKFVRDNSPHKERFDGRLAEKKMALVRQNFIKLKRLSTDEKLRQPKQFQDALEVLSSNKDSFLKFLQEPNSMFYQQLSDLHSNPPSSETKRITILKPAKMVDSNIGLGKKNEEQIKEGSQLSRINRLRFRRCWDPQRHRISVNIIRIGQQLYYFEEYQRRLINFIGIDEARKLVNNALVLITWVEMILSTICLCP